MPPPRVLIIGGGVIGLSSAYFLAKAGATVTLLDRGPAEGPNCSTGNAGIVAPSHFIPLAAPGMISQGIRWMFQPESPFALRPTLNPALLAWGWRFWRASSPRRVEAAKPLLRDLNLASRQRFVELAEQEGLDFGLRQHGLLMLCKTEAALHHERDVARQALALGLEAEVLDSQGIQQLDSAMQIDVAGGVYFPKDCHLDPAAFRRGLIAAIQRLGGEIHWNAQVQEIATARGRVERVIADHGEWRAEEFVLAGGVWTRELAKKLALRLPMQPGKGYSLTLPAPVAQPRICSILCEARVAVTPIGQGLRFGGTMEIGGAENLINARRVRGIIRSIPSYFPQFRAEHFENQPVWHGLRPCSPDGLPYLGRPRTWANVIVATGHAMLGLSLGPVTGLLVSQIALGQETGLDLRLLSPDRYA